eukprot:EG_transcript_25540
MFTKLLELSHHSEVGPMPQMEVENVLCSRKESIRSHPSVPRSARANPWFHRSCNPPVQNKMSEVCVASRCSECALATLVTSRAVKETEPTCYAYKVAHAYTSVASDPF